MQVSLLQQRCIQHAKNWSPVLQPLLTVK